MNEKSLQSESIRLSGSVYDVALWIWEHLVPKQGCADSLQGEALRVIENLAWEAQNNGNLNWDCSFEQAVAFLRQFFLSGLAVEAKIFDEASRNCIEKDLNRLENFLMPTELDSRVYLDELPYSKQDLYDRLTLHLVQFCHHFPTPIKYNLTQEC